MAGPSSLKTLNSIHLSSMKMKPPSSSSSTPLTSMKFKTLVQTFILSHVYRMARALTKAKSVIFQLLRDIHLNIQFLEFPLIKMKAKNSNKQKKLFFGSFRLHYNWCSSSHVMPVMLDNQCSHVYYDASWNSVINPTSLECEEMQLQEYSSELSRYLKWLEEKGNHIDHEYHHHNHEAETNEIDRLADLFIANCHEKFRLEKQESYRRFQEMMARSV